MAEVVANTWQAWPTEVRKVLRGLTLRGDSGLLQCVHRVEDLGTLHNTFVIFEAEKPVAWAMATWDRQGKEFDIMLYVRRDRRRLGYGRTLFNQAKQWVRGRRKPYFFFVDTHTNAIFFKKVAPEKF